MAKPSKTAERMTVGIVLVILAILFWLGNQRRLAIFVVLALFVPYVAVAAPFRCGGYTRQQKACRRVGNGLLIGCRDHRFDRLGRVFGRDRDRAASRYGSSGRPVRAARSAGISASQAAGEPTRLRAFDVLSFVVGVSSMVAGWLALWIGPS